MSKGFFHIDRRTWASICDLQKMNLAVAYLVLATGTGAANNVTKWSAKAVETWTGMRRLKAREAIEELVKLGYVKRALNGRRISHATHSLHGEARLQPTNSSGFRMHW
jgi:hypothetical protein